MSKTRLLSARKQTKPHRWGPSYDPDYRTCEDCGRTVCVHWSMGEKQGGGCKAKNRENENERDND